MGRARIALVTLLLAGAIANGAGAQDAKPAEDAADENAAAPPADAPQPTGYEPDQRGALDELTSAPEPAPTPAAYDVESRVSESEPAPAPPLFYLEAQTGYGYVDPDEGHHGFTFGLAFGLHIGPLDLGARYVHGVYQDDLDGNAAAVEARLGLLEGAIVPQLRLAVGVLALSDVAGFGAGGAPGTLVGPSFEAGVGVRATLHESLTLGLAADAGFAPISNATADSKSFELRLHIDLGVHF